MIEELENKLKELEKVVKEIKESSRELENLILLDKAEKIINFSN